MVCNLAYRGEGAMVGAGRAGARANLTNEASRSTKRLRIGTSCDVASWSPLSDNQPCSEGAIRPSGAGGIRENVIWLGINVVSQPRQQGHRRALILALAPIDPNPRNQGLAKLAKSVEPTLACASGANPAANALVPPEIPITPYDPRMARTDELFDPRPNSAPPRRPTPAKTHSH